MAYLLRFGTYTFPNTYFPAERPLANIVPSSKLPRSIGARQITGYPDSVRLSIKGGLVKGPIKTRGLVSLDATRDDILAALSAGPANLYFGRDDRYYRNAQYDRFSDSYGPTGYGRVVDNDIGFIVPDPRQFAVAASADTWTVSGSAQTHGVTAGGTAAAEPIISITVSGVGAKTIAYTITNTTTGQAFTLTGNVTGGDVIVVNCIDKTVTIASVDKLTLFDGQWPSLQVGANSWSEAYVTNALSQIVFSWQDRYL